MKSLAPALLLSMPQLVDENFHRTVVLLCWHSEDEGAFGLVVNRRVTTSGRVVVNLDPPLTTDRELEFWVGGPVEPQRSWILVGAEPPEKDGQDKKISDTLHLSTSPILLRRVLETAPPPRTRLMLGYSGWGPGQLEAELQESAWLISDVSDDLIFDTPPEAMWEKAIRRLGADPSVLHTGRGVH